MTTSSKRRASLFISYRTMLKKFTKTVALFVGLAVAVAMPISNTFNAEADGVAEIAAGTGYSQSKVKSLLHRTRRGLKEHLRKEGYDL